MRKSSLLGFLLAACFLLCLISINSPALRVGLRGLTAAAADEEEEEAAWNADADTVCVLLLRERSHGFCLE